MLLVAVVRAIRVTVVEEFVSFCVEEAHAFAFHGLLHLVHLQVVKEGLVALLLVACHVVPWRGHLGPILRVVLKMLHLLRAHLLSLAMLVTGHVSTLLALAMHGRYLLLKLGEISRREGLNLVRHLARTGWRGRPCGATAVRAAFGRRVVGRALATMG